MRFLKKYFRLISRICVFFILGYVLYIFQSQYSLLQMRGKSFQRLEAKLQSLNAKSERFARPKFTAPDQIFNKDIDFAANSKNEVEKSLEDITFNIEDMLDENGQPFQIVLWQHRSGIPGYLANPKECLGNISCQIFYANSDQTSAHAVVFLAGHLSRDSFPKNRKPDQLYAWWSLESPLHSAPPPSDVDGLFNLTFTYKTNADVYAPYGSINLILRELRAAGETNLDALLMKKRGSGKMAAWAVSNCYGKRMKYAKELMGAGLKVDTFGGCFDGRPLGQGRYSDAMYEELSQYKFYLSFENSISCKDYFTEKFWFNGLRSGTVPVVWGPKKSDLLKVVPTKSFIHADDFSSPQELVAYLNYLESNETAYSEYLQWRTWVNEPEKTEERLKMKNRENDLRSFCKLCSIVQSNARRKKLGLPVPQKVVKSVNEVWLGSEQGQCHK